MHQTGVLLVNLGTPDDPSVRSVRRYLREFLLDPRVIDLPTVARYLLVYGLILPLRPQRSAKAYQQIWQPEGSPLRLHTQKLEKTLSDKLGDRFLVVSAMRYGNPSIPSGIAQLSGCKKIMILPLFPQYASASSGSAIAKCLDEIGKQWNIPSTTVIDHFYQNPGFIQSYSHIIRQHLEPDTFLLFSYHGLPQRHINKSACQNTCTEQACPIIDDSNYFCYRAQCYHTSQQIADTLALDEKSYTTTFQSRLGRTPWIMPYTDQKLIALRQAGIKKLAIVCPSFVADCLETLEEIGIQARKQWQSLGGDTFTLIPCLNTHPNWVNTLADMIENQESLLAKDSKQLYPNLHTTL